MRTSSTSLWIPQKFMCRRWSPWLFNPFSMNPFEEFCHTDSFSLSNPLYFCERTQKDTAVYSNQHFFLILSRCLSKDRRNVFFFEIGRDVEGIEVLEVLSWRILGAERSWAKVRMKWGTVRGPRSSEALKCLRRAERPEREGSSRTQYTHMSINIEKVVYLWS